jgi:hypothetical protein
MNLRQGRRKVGIPVSGRRFRRRDDRVHAVAQAGPHRGETVLRFALSGALPCPRMINVDGHPAYASAVAELKQTGELARRCRCRTAPYLNNIIEQDHRFIKKQITASLGFRSMEGACRTIEGYEAMHAIRKRPPFHFSCRSVAQTDEVHTSVCEIREALPMDLSDAGTSHQSNGMTDTIHWCSVPEMRVQSLVILARMESAVAVHTNGRCERL